ncbi:type II toxin-antitoxin system HicB family antitoxin [Anaeromassilibacillus senegalensis]|uniref:type II toxin-antitoxin system HicB family antitoxin n=1 Tax=Anaeromassilibacillus senegalensis TaxID=1673717 RepID=UPI0006824196|nr:type II toxin-antitoxin system HicB family antitoxin [Anaeromassilibacillus senegalensis]
MFSAYPACFFKEANGYSVIFPDLNWLSTCGKTLDQALSMAVDCLAGYLYSCQRENESIPYPSSMENINLEDIANELELNSGESFVNMVTVDVDEYAKVHFEKSVKKTLTIPAWLNAAALEKGINFSQVLQEALKERLSAIK